MAAGITGRPRSDGSTSIAEFTLDGRCTAAAESESNNERVAPTQSYARRWAARSAGDRRAGAGLRPDDVVARRAVNVGGGVTGKGKRESTTGVVSRGVPSVAGASEALS